MTAVERPSLPLTSTRELRVETSTACNYRCAMCPRERLTRGQRVMSDALFAAILRGARADLPQLSMCTVSGFGDFAADPGWREKLGLARDLFDDVHVVTNLSLVRDEDLPLLAERTTEVRVSVYGSDEASYRRAHRPRGRVSYARIAARVRALVQLGARVTLTCCAIDENRDQIGRWIEIWRPLVAQLEVWRPHNWIDGRDYRRLAAQRLLSCGRPASGPIQVQVDGTVNVCCFDYDGKMIVGDLTRTSLAEILDGAELRRIRRLHAEGRADDLPLCAVCDQRDPPEAKADYLLYCSSTLTELRVRQTSSRRESLPTPPPLER